MYPYTYEETGWYMTKLKKGVNNMIVDNQWSHLLNDYLKNSDAHRDFI